jgi:hypothetical protein
MRPFSFEFESKVYQESYFPAPLLSRSPRAFPDRNLAEYDHLAVYLAAEEAVAATMEVFLVVVVALAAEGTQQASG